HAGTRRPAVEALENLVHVLPGFDQRSGQRRLEREIAGCAPFALEAPIDGRILVDLKRYHAPTLFRREDFSGFAPWQIDDWPRTHRKSIPLVDRDAEWLVAAAIAPVEDSAQLG